MKGTDAMHNSGELSSDHYLDVEAITEIRLWIVQHLKAHGGRSTRAELECRFGEDSCEFHVAIEGLDDSHVVMFDRCGEEVFLLSSRVQ
jgi:hypothetical protein